MELKRKTVVIKCAAAAAGLGCAMFVGMMFPNGSGTVNTGSLSGSLVQNDTAAADKTSVKQLEADAALAESQQEIDHRKAEIGEYQMFTVTSTPVVEFLSAAEVKSDKNKDKKEEKADEEEKADKAYEQLNIEDFSVILPDDGTEVYDIRTEPLGLTATRSVANEYYTVKDLISGGVVTMNAHEMLCRMVYNEIGAQWNEQAIKAQIVAAYNHLRYSDSIGHVPTIALKSGYPEVIERCVSEVEGQCIVYNGELVNAAYAASTAGYSADSRYIFGIEYPYLKPVVGEYDQDDPNFGVVKTISADTIRKAFSDKYGITLSDDCRNWFEVLSMHAGRYVYTINIDGQITISGSDMRTLLGLKSSAFEISYSGGDFEFTTYGFGHGVGLSQWGAKLYADHGWTYDQILRHYYVNTTIVLSDENAGAVERGKNPPADIPAQAEVNDEDDLTEVHTEDITADSMPTARESTDTSSAAPAAVQEPVQPVTESKADQPSSADEPSAPESSAPDSSVSENESVPDDTEAQSDTSAEESKSIAEECFSKGGL